MRCLIVAALVLAACDGTTQGAGDGGAGDLAGVDLAGPTGDLAQLPTCSMSCGATSVCVLLTCPATPTPACATSTCGPSCGCVTCPAGEGSCTTYQGQLACGPPGTCG